MANGYFVVQNGLQVGPLTIDASTGTINTSGDVSITGNLGVSQISKNDSSVSINDTGSGSNITLTIDGGVEHVLTADTTTLNNTLTINGNAAFDGRQVTQYDSIFDLHTYGNLAAWASDDGKDIGLRMHYYKGADKIAFLGWENTTQSLQYIADATETNSNVSGTFGNVQFGSLLLSNSTVSSSTTTGAFIVTGGVGIGGKTYQGGQLNVTDTTTATSTSTGAVVVTGGTGIGGNLHVGGTITGTVATVSQPTITTMAGLTSFGVNGGTTVAQGNLTVAGNLTVQGASLTISSAALSVQDPIINLHSPNDLAPLTTDDGADIGIKMHYYKSGDKAAFLGWQNSTGYLEWYDSGSDVGNVFTGTTQGTIKTGQLILSNTTATTSTTTGALTVAGGIGVAGNITLGGSLVPSGNVSSNLGDSTHWFGTFFGIATQAKYADLAENYQADKAYAPGTVVMFGGSAEVTIADADTTRVAGVVSTNPAHLMNGGLQGATVVPLALQGRVPCNVVGPVAKGDLMVSAGFGFAKANNNASVGQVIGKALADLPGATKGQIEVVVGRL